MAIYSGADRTRPYIGRGSIKEVYRGADLIWRKIQYIVGSDGNNTIQATYGNGSSNWYGNPLQCKGVWAVDVTGFTRLTFDLSAHYVWYTNPDDSSLHVNATTKYGYSTTAKTVGTVYNQNTFAAYHQFTNDNRGSYTFDISGVSGTIYIWIGTAQAGGGINASCNLYNIYLS